MSHRKDSTSCDAFVRKKLVYKFLDTPVIHYGNDHETEAINSYVNYQSKNGKTVSVNSCGLSVDPSMPWLATSPDGFVFDPMEKYHKQGCLEVKCPLSWVCLV